jgi:spermidine synthase
VCDSARFYRDCAAVLADEGVMTVNLFGRDASFAGSVARIGAVFGAGRTIALRPTREGNTIVAAWKGEALPEREVLAARAQNIESRFRLPARKWLRMLRPLSDCTDA